MIKTSTYGQSPYTEASLAHPLGTCPKSGKWDGHFENVVPNASSAGRKKKKKSDRDHRIREMFYLFFNATPPNDARDVFVDSDSTIAANGMLDDRGSTNVDDPKENSGSGDGGGGGGDGSGNENKLPLLPKGYIHVRGYGTNRFGTFEIVGSLDPQTGTLQCQRMYVPVPTAAEISKATGQNRSSSGRFLSGLDFTVPGEEDDKKREKPSRKRKSTWKKRDMDGTFEDVVGVGADGAPILAGAAGGGGSGGVPSGTIDIASIVKKRSRLSNESAVSSHRSSTTPGSAKASFPQCRGGLLDRPSSLSIQIPPHTGGTMSSSATLKPSPPSRTLSRSVSSGSGKKGSKKKKSKGGGGTPTATSQPTYKAMPGGTTVTRQPPMVTVVPKLPSAGDPFLARWRAAHYLYYQRIEQETSEGGEGTHHASSTTHPSLSSSGGGGGAGAAASSGGKSGGGGVSTNNNSKNLIKINFVVYEGEMHDGIREGRGMCLYNNNTLYEGQWKRNKEHGTGTLMTADRKRIIYEGAWEKGKMHGHGAYYYYIESMTGNKKIVKENGKYIGQFRQNLRNGHGVYTLPDTSIYDGEWRDNIQNGYGIFRWADGSIYEGSWRDGKRHGTSGILIASDGFRYEGSWVNNSMEGRGVATYPKGQIYDGTWVAGKREGRGTIRFTNGAVYEGRFKEDYMEGQGTMKMNRNVIIPKLASAEEEEADGKNKKKKKEETATPSTEGTSVGNDEKHDWMIPLQFQSDISHIHQKAGFTQIGL
ncbi:hypothetical protein ACHAXR_012618 [Thalassiosira sp. AJA248-18]